MKTLSALLLAGLLALSLPVSAADMQYTLVRGELWKGVNIGGSAPRGLNSICRGFECYTLKSMVPLGNAEKRRFGIEGSGGSWEQLSSASGVVQQADGRLRLPPELGQALYEVAFRSYLSSKTGR